MCRKYTALSDLLKTDARSAQAFRAVSIYLDEWMSLSRRNIFSPARMSLFCFLRQRDCFTDARCASFRRFAFSFSIFSSSRRGVHGLDLSSLLLGRVRFIFRLRKHIVFLPTVGGLSAGYGSTMLKIQSSESPQERIANTLLSRRYKMTIAARSRVRLFHFVQYS